MQARGSKARGLLMALSCTLGAGLAGFGRCGGPAADSWVLTWSDEFEGTAGALPDPARWGFDVGTGTNGWGNAQQEYDTDRPENAALDGQGHLVITARKEAFQGSQYTSARLHTQGRFSQRYGRFEARMRLPRGQGLWPAFWMLGDSFDTQGWPDCGEIDVMEYRGQEPTRVTGTLHGRGYSGGSAITGSTPLPGGGAFDEAFHTFGVEWTPDWVAWELDGELWQVIPRSAIPAGAPWAFDQPFFLLLNVAVGGNYVGNPDPSIFPPGGITTEIDWVRVYRKDG